MRIEIQAPKEIQVMRSELLGTQPKLIDTPKQHPKQTASEGVDGKMENGPLAAFLKVFPKVELVHSFLIVPVFVANFVRNRTPVFVAGFVRNRTLNGRFPATSALPSRVRIFTNPATLF